LIGRVGFTIVVDGIGSGSFGLGDGTGEGVSEGRDDGVGDGSVFFKSPEFDEADCGG
jgi:hypothetical protein